MTGDSRQLREPRQRPSLARFVWERGYTWQEAGELFGCSGEAVRLWCLPFDDPARRTPDRSSMEKIVAGTNGEVTAADFYQPTVAVVGAVNMEVQP